MSKNFLQVSPLHRIQYEVCGNPDGVTYLFVHGGPGVGCSELDKRFFDFNTHRVIFFDQRGAAKSLPFGEIKENTTQHLVNDINALLDHLQIKKVILFGGSWGTTLSLAYAIQNPNRVNGLLLRGLFLADKEATDYFWGGGAIKQLRPTAWNRFISHVPEKSTLSPTQYYLDKILNGTPEEQEHYAFEFTYYEISVFKNDISDTEIKSILSQMPYKSFALLEAHYMSNYCFLEEGYILKNAKVLEQIPIKVVHGKDDIICPLHYAIHFDQHVKSSILYITDGGHSDRETETEHKLKEIITANEW